MMATGKGSRTITGGIDVTPIVQIGIDLSLSLTAELYARDCAGVVARLAVDGRFREGVVALVQRHVAATLAADVVERAGRLPLLGDEAIQQNFEALVVEVLELHEGSVARG
jgi:hypothetical protein